MLHEKYEKNSIMTEMVLICESCGKRLTFPAQLSGTSLACPFCGHLFALPKPSQPLPPPLQNPGVAATGSVIQQAAGLKGIMMAVTIGCCLVAGVPITAPADTQNIPTPFPNDPAHVIVRVNEFAALSNGPWVISLPLGEDFGNYRCVFVDFRAKPVAAQVRQTGGTINKISGLEYIMSPLGLTAKVMPSGISIERAKESALTLPIGSLLTFIRIIRVGAGDIVIWIRGRNLAGCPARETEKGFAVSVPRGAIPDAWRFALNANTIECHASFKGQTRPEIFDFRITETPSNLVINLMIDENRRDTIWEAMQTEDTSAGGSSGPEETTIASASATLRFCEKGKPDEAMLVITTQSEGKP